LSSHSSTLYFPTSFSHVVQVSLHYLAVSSTRRPQSVIDFISPEKELTLSVPMRSKTPVPSSSSKSSRSLFVKRKNHQTCTV